MAFADDIVLIANNEEELPELVSKCKVTVSTDDSLELVPRGMA